MPLLLDTGILYALADADDAWHARARACIEANREPLIAPVTVVPEVTYLIRSRLGAEAERAFVAAVAAGELAVEGLVAGDLRRCAVLVDEYPQIGFVDASVVSVAERLRLHVLATTDRRHFGAIRPRHVKAFRLVP